MVYRYVIHICDITNIVFHAHYVVKVPASYSLVVRTCPSNYSSEISPIKWALTSLFTS